MPPQVAKFLYFCIGISKAVLMRYELFIANRLQLGQASQKGSPSLNVAVAGIVLAIVVMILSVVIILGFKSEINGKVLALDAHQKISNATLGIDDNYSTVRGSEVFRNLMGDSSALANIKSMSLIAEKTAILKTEDDFKGVMFRGVDDGYDWDFLKSKLDAGRTPNIKSSKSTTEIVISKCIANQLHLKVGDKVLTYFIDNKVKARKNEIVGIYNTDFDTFDDTYILGNIAQIQSVNGWNEDTGNYVAVNLRNTNELREQTYTLYSHLAKCVYEQQSPTLYNVTNTYRNNISLFTWLKMLDMNVVIILALMIVVSGFTLVTALFMIILERIKMIGLLKSLGATNGSIRQIFIYLTQKLIFKSIIWGNLIGIGLALLQKNFHIVTLNPDAYYMPYVPIELNASGLIVLNVSVIVISYITLLAPSYIISTIKPSTTIRFE